MLFISSHSVATDFYLGGRRPADYCREPGLGMVPSRTVVYYRCLPVAGGTARALPDYGCPPCLVRPIGAIGFFSSRLPVNPFPAFDPDIEWMLACLDDRHHVGLLYQARMGTSTCKHQFDRAGLFRNELQEVIH